MLIVSLYSLLLIKSASRNSEATFYESQCLAVVFGMISMFVFQFVNYNFLGDSWKSISVFCVLFIIFTIFFGINIKGLSGVNAKAWISLPGGSTFQPSELAKIGFILTFAKHLSFLKKTFNLDKPIHLILLLLHMMVPFLLTHIQGDDGAAIIFVFISLFMAFISGIKLRYFLFLIIGFISSVPFLWEYILAPYQKKRIINQLDPEKDPLGIGFQQIQGKLSIGSGGFLGKGIFEGDRVADKIVPIQESDFILSVAGEEFGFLGCFLIIILLSCIICRIFYIIKNCRDSLGVYICYGIIALIASQAVFNLGMCLSFLPVIGVTLPFFSSGGSSFLCLLIGIGIVQNIYIKNLGYDKNLSF